MSRRRSFVDGVIVVAVALATRAVMVAWAQGRLPPAADGHYYHVIARRIAAGFGYTWLWDDGSVTTAAHYPVGYPGLVGAVYAMVGLDPMAAMVTNLVVGVLAAGAATWWVSRRHGRAAAYLAGLAVALHPTLVLYTPALMTEGVVGALLLIVGAVTVRARDSEGAAAWIARGAGGLLLGFTVLVRPQSLLLGPFLGWVSARRLPHRWVAAAVVPFIAALVVAPWTARNCRYMDRCVVVSANAGWNLYIGAAPHSQGAWVPLVGEHFPQRCKAVQGEASKDRCLLEAAIERIRGAPLSWLSRSPAKLSHTFDFAGAAGAYVQESNGALLSAADRARWDALEYWTQRWLLALALLAFAVEAVRGRIHGEGAWSTPFAAAVALLGAASLLLTRAGWPGYLALPLALALAGEVRALRSPLWTLTGAAVATTAVTHAVFFGATRYAIVAFPLIAACAGVGVASVWRTGRDPALLTGATSPGDTPLQETNACR